jgi:hypothetical protein
VFLGQDCPSLSHVVKKTGRDSDPIKFEMESATTDVSFRRILLGQDTHALTHCSHYV